MGQAGEPAPQEFHKLRLLKLDASQLSKDGVVISSFDYTLDLVGHRRVVQEQNGRKVEYEYDRLYRFTKETISDSVAGNRIVEYSYDKVGNRIRKIDANQAYAQVLEEYTPGGAVQASYVYGKDLISQNRGGVRSFYHVDGLGSTRALTNASGVVTDTYDYGAYGNLLGSVSNTVNNYRFAGEQFDPYLGDYYLRRRYYDSDSGRFTATDPFEGLLTEPLSRAKYPYVHGNPVNAIDPSGLFQEGELGVTLKISEILNVLRPALPLIRFVGRTARTAGTTIFGVSLAHQANLALSSLTIRACALAGERNCEAGIPIVFYGNQFQNLPLENTTLHIKEAINYGGGIPPVLSAMRGTGDRGWLNQTPECNSWARRRYNAQLNQSRGVPPDTFIGACDEYPFHATLQGGQTNYLAGKVSLRLVPSAEDFPQMQLMTTNRLRQAGVIPGDPLRSWYGVVPIPELPESFWQPRTWFF